MRKMFRNRNGQTAIEYSLIIMVIGIAIVTAVSSLGTQTKSMFDRVATGFSK